MIIFFYGEDVYRLREKLKALKDKFISASLGDTNLAILEGNRSEYNEISRQVLAMPFLSKTRLVIIENFLKEGKKDVQEKIGEFLPKVPDSTVLVFAEVNNPDKRTSLYKKLVKVKMVQEFKPLEEIQVKRWLKKEAEGRGVNLETDAINILSSYFGGDLFRQKNELEKLATSVQHRKDKTITSTDVKKMVRPQVESNIFALTDYIGERNFKAATAELDRLEKNGENEIYILTMVVRQFRNLLIIKDTLNRKGQISSYQLAKEVGMNPYVVQKTMPAAQNFQWQKLRQIYKTLLSFDLALKTGKMEGKVALNLFLAKFCN